MENESDLRKTWLTLFSLSSVLFVIIGLAMIFVDTRYVNGSQFIITAAVFLTAIFLITTNKIETNFSNPIMALGFIFSVIGLTNPISPGIYFGMWGLGIILFLTGLFNKNK